MQAQEFINITLPFIAKRFQKQVLRKLGYYYASEFARKAGCSKQYISKAKGKFDIIEFEGREYFRYEDTSKHLTA